MKLPCRLCPSLAGTILLVLTSLAPALRAAQVAAVPIVELRAAVAKALLLIERSSAFALQERACFTCHHGAHASLVINDAWVAASPSTRAIPRTVGSRLPRPH